MQLGDFFAGVRVFGVSQFVFQRAQFGVAVKHVINGGGVERRRFLGDRGDAPCCGNVAVAVFGLQLTA